MNKSNRGITLIALVITIIVLLILAGVSIATLTGNNGILTQAGTAKEETKKKTALEKVQVEVAGSRTEKEAVDLALLNTNLGHINHLTYHGSALSESNLIESLPATVTVDGYTILITINGLVTIEGEAETVLLPSTADTHPYLPDSQSVLLENSNLDTGLVIQDGKQNEWVWIEVPKSQVFQTATSETDYTAIETDLQMYAADYSTLDYTDTYYTGCGLANQTEYNTLKNTMLCSIYKNGGFWIGRYEAGISDDSERTSYTEITDLSPTAVSLQDKIPYTYITCSEAQTLASKMSSSNSYTSSLLFGIQWDVTLKYIESKNATNGDGVTIDQNKLKTDSTAWGNYNNATFIVHRGSYSTDPRVANSWQKVTEQEGGYTKPGGVPSISLTTGATRRNSILNIYDLAGNLKEWTLEKSYFSTLPCVYRSGGFSGDGKGYHFSSRNNEKSSESAFNVGFRATLF